MSVLKNMSNTNKSLDELKEILKPYSEIKIFSNPTDGFKIMFYYDDINIFEDIKKKIINTQTVTSYCGNFITYYTISKSGYEIQIKGSADTTIYCIYDTTKKDL